MNCVCLIPTTRPKAVKLAVKAAKADGWKTVVLADTDHEGPGVTREKLLAGLKGDVLVRYCDDDDTLLPHREAALKVFTETAVDVVYFNHETSSTQVPGTYLTNPFTGDPRKDARLVHPWSWVARLSALRAVQARLGFVWDPSIPIREGGHTWLNFIETGLVIQHLPLVAYRYNVADGYHLHPEFPTYTDSLTKRLRGPRDL